MRGLRRNLLVFGLGIVLSVLSCMTVMASEKGNGLTYLKGEHSCYVQSPVQPRANTVCGGLTYHKMMSSGMGFVDINGQRYITGGAAWQCSNCKLVMVTEGDYYMGTMSAIGKWATMYANENISGNGVYIDGPSSYGTCNSSTMSGYKFFLR